MVWTLLPVNYTNAVWSGLKKYNLITNPDDTVSLQDVTVYSNKETSFFGANDANLINGAINTLMTLDGVSEISEPDEESKIPLYAEGNINFITLKTLKEAIGLPKYGSTLPDTGNEGDVFFLITEE